VIVVVAEKPSVARDLGRVLGATRREDGCLVGERHIVTWAIGHLVTLPSPEQVDPAWKAWRMESLPMLPRSFPLQVLSPTRAQFEVVKRLLTRRDVREVVCATDAGREGELIFRHIAELCSLRAPVKRLWISSLTDNAIREGFQRMGPASAYDALADAARGRSRADWLVGMNLSRAYTLRARTLGQGEDTPLFSVGRVQTPTLAILVERERAIRSFVPEEYAEVELTLEKTGETGPAFSARFVRTDTDAEPARLAPNHEEARDLVARAEAGHIAVHAVEREEKRARPQLLYDLTELQRHASRLYGFSAAHTLSVAQRLYEEHKLLSYPRTDSRHLSADVATTLPQIVAAVRGPFEDLLEEGTGGRPLGRRFVDDTQVGDHHAIIPTGKPSRLSSGSDEHKLYDLVVRRLLAAYQSDHVWAVTSVRIQVRQGNSEPDRYLSRGSTVLNEGHRRLDVKPRRPSAVAADALPVLAAEDPLTLLAARIDEKQTRPPPHHNEASLLTAMETAGRDLDDRELSRAMRDRGLGTPATRAAIIETLLQRGFVERDEQRMRATQRGEALVDLVHPHVKSPAMTGEWEYKLRQIERGELTLDCFVEDIERYVREVIGDARKGMSTRPESGFTPQVGRSGTLFANPAAPLPVAPRPEVPRGPDGTPDLEAVLRTRFGHDRFRPHQRDVIAQLVAGKDVLLVMPTGAGKSLCYQLPGIARGGTTLVVCPLIALMDDQTQKLQKAGFRAERIHSGLGREGSREVCRAYLRGELDFLFIAPERLKVPGFPELLARRPPSLIAIDEAHCISQWGHDFRPDYRMLQSRLPLRSGTPIVALTATATPEVQADIVAQLGVPDAVRSIHGFRRDNLAVHVVEALPSQRDALTLQILREKGRTPAIVYAPTRARTDEIAKTLGQHFRAGAYHAGMDAAQRDRVQSAFLAGELDIIAATIAFGMGIDKADVRTVMHLASPSSIEGYYQEIGRAGRDGKASAAVMLCSPGDQRTHQFFFERDYPETSELRRVYAAVCEEPVFRGTLARRLQLEDDALERILDKLWMHGAVQVDGEDVVHGRGDSFTLSYPRHRAAKAAQLAHVSRYLHTESCRMLALVRHFGDADDSGEACGRCDRCRPGDGLARSIATQRPSEAPKRRSPKATQVGVARRVRGVGSAEAPFAVVEALRDFRRREATAKNVPAFRILTDRVLVAVARERPRSAAELLNVPGVGASLAKRYGAKLLAVIEQCS
jgi:DNA topoisomerase-3